MRWLDDSVTCTAMAMAMGMCDPGAVGLSDQSGKLLPKPCVTRGQTD